MRWQIAVVGIFLIALVFASQGVLLERSMPYLVGHGFLIIVVSAIYTQVRRGEFVTERLLRREEEIEALSAYAERRRITGDLHDFLGQTFSVINVKAELSRKLLKSDPERVAKELDELADVSRAALGQVRVAINGYSGLALQDEMTTAESLLEAAGVTLHAKYEETILPSAIETTLALILRECVTNVVRHAKASQCHIDVAKQDGIMEMTVSDNGTGFNTNDGRGLRGIRERAMRMSAELNIDGTSGTKVCVRIPILMGKVDGDAPCPD